MCTLKFFCNPEIMFVQFVLRFLLSLAVFLYLWQICQHKQCLVVSIAMDGSLYSLLCGEHVYWLSMHETVFSAGLGLTSLLIQAEAVVVT